MKPAVLWPYKADFFILITEKKVLGRKQERVLPIFCSVNNLLDLIRDISVQLKTALSEYYDTRLLKQYICYVINTA